MVKIKLNKIELKLEKELIKNLKRYNYSVEKALGEVLNRSLWKFSNKLERYKCLKCGKPTDSTLTMYEVHLLNKGRKTRKDLGVCECKD